MTNKERIDNLELEVKNIQCGINEIKGLLLKGNKVIKEPIEYSPIQEEVIIETNGIREMTTSEALCGVKPKPMPQGPIPVDEKGRVTDPSWQYEVGKDGKRWMVKINQNGDVIDRYPFEAYNRQIEERNDWLKDKDRLVKLHGFQQAAIKKNEILKMKLQEA